ncbi:PUR family DNA/RNA-binding protein [Ornithobacterium rhinotracheale]
MADRTFNQVDEQEEIFSRALRAGRRTYFFDVRETKAGDYYLTITESKKSINPDGSYYFKKHKIYLYKEGFESFQENLKECSNFIIENKGEEVISERHQSSYDDNSNKESVSTDNEDLDKFTDIKFEDI